MSGPRRSLSTLAGRAPALWWWNCLERFVSWRHGKQAAQTSGQTKQQIKDTSSENGLFIFPPSFNSSLQIFQRRTQTESCYKPLSLSLVHCLPTGDHLPRRWNKLHILRILNRSRIFFVFQRVGIAVAYQCQTLVLPRCFMKSFVYAVSSKFWSDIFYKGIPNTRFIYIYDTCLWLPSYFFFCIYSYSYSKSVTQNWNWKWVKGKLMFLNGIGHCEVFLFFIKPI